MKPFIFLGLLALVSLSSALELHLPVPVEAKEKNLVVDLQQSPKVEWIGSIVQGAVTGAVEGAAASAVVGAAVGAVVGTAAGGVGAGPGAIAGAETGAEMGAAAGAIQGAVTAAISGNSGGTSVGNSGGGYSGGEEATAEEIAEVATTEEIAEVATAEEIVEAATAEEIAEEATTEEIAEEATTEEIAEVATAEEIVEEATAEEIAVVVIAAATAEETVEVATAEEIAVVVTAEEIAVVVTAEEIAVVVIAAATAEVVTVEEIAEEVTVEEIVEADIVAEVATAAAAAATAAEATAVMRLKKRWMSKHRVLPFRAVRAKQIKWSHTALLAKGILMTEDSLPVSLLGWAIKILTTEDVDKKAEYTTQAVARWRDGRIALVYSKKDGIQTNTISEPARTIGLNLPANKMPKRRAATTLAGRIDILHSLVHIESMAIDLTWDLIARYYDMAKPPDDKEQLPREFFDDWVKIANDEAKHYMLLNERLKELGSYYGARPAHNGLWTSAMETADSLLNRLCIEHMVHEARGLDMNPQTSARFREAGDDVTANLLDVILKDEITHVGAGLKWFIYLCRERSTPPKDPIQTFHAIVRAKFRGVLKPPFNVAGRAAAGLTEEWYIPLSTRESNLPTDASPTTESAPS